MQHEYWSMKTVGLECTVEVEGEDESRHQLEVTKAVSDKSEQGGGVVKARFSWAVWG